MILGFAFFLLATAASVLTYWGIFSFPNWPFIWVLPLFIPLYYLACFALWILWLGVCALFVKKDETYVYPPNKAAQWIVRQTAYQILFVLRVKTHATGLGKFPKADIPVVLINNHLSVFDEFAIAAFFPRDFIFITKPQNFKIPIGGAWMRYAGYLPIVQGDIAGGAKVIADATSYIRDRKLSICVAPEGTRNKTFPDPLLLPFHPGTFHLALNSGAPVIACAIQNTNAITKRFPLKRTHIYLDIVGVVEQDEYFSMSAKELCLLSRSFIEKRFEQKEARFYHFKKKEEKKDS